MNAVWAKFLGGSYALALLFCSTIASAENLGSLTNFDHDNKGDLAVFNRSDASLTFRGSINTTFKSQRIGTIGAIPVIGDFDGDGLADKGSFNRTTGKWKIVYATGVGKVFTFGNARTLPVPARFTHTSCTDLATFDPVTRIWRIRDCQTEETREFNFGRTGDIALAADLTCDGISEAVLYRRQTGHWYYQAAVRNSQVKDFRFGLPADIPLVADFDLDGCEQVAVYRPEGNFFVVADNAQKGKVSKIKQWGIPGDHPAIVNIDGGGSDFAVLRPANNTYYVSTDKGKFVQVAFEKPIATETDVIPEFDFDDIDFGGDGGDFEPIDSGDFEGIIEEIIGNLIGGFSVRTAKSSPTPRAVEIAPAALPVPLTNPGFNRTKTPGTYNGDLFSDIVLIRNTLDQKIWSIRHGDNTTSTYVFGLPTDRLLVAADYDGDGTTDPAFTRVYGNGLRWFIRTDNGRTETVDFGLKDDKALAGDFDCDGIADKAVARVNGAFLSWYVQFSRDGSIKTKDFGLAADKFFAADIDGDTCDELVLAQDQAGGLWWFSYDFLTKKAVGPIQWGLSADAMLPPMDFNGDGTADIIVSRPTFYGSRHFFIRDFNSNGTLAELVELGFATDIPVTGFFNGQNRAELAVYRPGADGGPSTTFIRAPNGVIHSIPFGMGADQILSPAGITPKQGSTNGVTCDVTTDFKDGTQRGALWKPVSDNTGNVVFLLPPSYWSATEEIKIYGAEGNHITNAKHRSCCANGGRAHFDVPKTARYLAQFNPLTVQLTLDNGATECRIVSDARVRQD